MSSVKDLVIAEGLRAEEAADAPAGPETRVTRGHGRSRTLQVRLNDDEYEMLTALAEAKGLPVSTLVRTLLHPVLSPTADAPAELIARMRQELDLLAHHIETRR